MSQLPCFSQPPEALSKPVRDYRNFNAEVFCQLLVAKDWYNFDLSIDPDIQWEIIYQTAMEIVSVMCPLIQVG